MIDCSPYGVSVDLGKLPSILSAVQERNDAVAREIATLQAAEGMVYALRIDCNSDISSQQIIRMDSALQQAQTDLKGQQSLLASVQSELACLRNTEFALMTQRVGNLQGSLDELLSRYDPPFVPWLTTGLTEVYRICDLPKRTCSICAWQCATRTGSS